MNKKQESKEKSNKDIIPRWNVDKETQKSEETENV